MKNLRKLVHAIQSELNESETTFKKSHIYELISAYFGCRSYAAYQVDLSLNKISHEKLKIAKGLCFDRALELGFDASSALLASQCIARQFDEIFQLNILLGRVIVHLENLKSINGQNEAIVFKRVKALLDKDISSACLLAVVTGANIISRFKQNQHNSSAEYWYNRRLTGSKLSQLHAEIADNFAYVKVFIDLLKYIAANQTALHLPGPIALKPNSGDKLNRAWTDLFAQNADEVLQALDLLSTLDNTIKSDEYNRLGMDWLALELDTNPMNY